MGAVRALGLGALFAVAGCTASPSSGMLVQAVTCSCSGTGPGGTPLTVNCGATACGSDNNTWLCFSNGSWTYESAGCASDGGTGSDAGCSCSGTGPGNTPLSVSCGQTACGSDDNTWLCVSNGSWSYESAGCVLDAGAGSDGGCSCSGTGPGNTPLNVSCGQTACGSDDNTWLCASNQNWAYASSGCGSSDAGCVCHGTGPGNNPITVSCGESACGSDDNYWFCNSNGAWSFSQYGCPDLSHPPDLTPPCQCNGTGPGNVPLTVGCGQTACGSDDNTWLCVSADNWTYESAGCGNGDMAVTGCQCSGTGPGGAPLTVSCGQTACGSDDNTWICEASNTWSYASAGCNVDLATTGCQCNG